MRKVNRIYCIRAKWCKTAYAFFIICVVLAYTTFLDSKYYPFFIIGIVALILLTLTAFYVEELQTE
ncbi:MAG: hypothetical protein QXL71_09120 [Candidatus Bathyarchaeia archaeon]